MATRAMKDDSPAESLIPVPETRSAVRQIGRYSVYRRFVRVNDPAASHLA